MKYEDLKKAAKEIKMSEEMKKRIIDNCYLQTTDKEENVMKNTNKGLKRMLQLVAIIAILAVSVGAGVINHIRGFKDVVKNGAVVGSVFNEETEKIELEAQVGDELVVTANILDYQNMPYSVLDAIESMHYSICDGDDLDVAVTKGRVASSSDFVDGKVTFNVPLEDIPEGEYTLVVREFVGTSKADAPLPICGTWVCSFVK